MEGSKSPGRLLEELSHNKLSLEKMAQVCMECVHSDRLSERACVRMAMCLTGLAAKQALDR